MIRCKLKVCPRCGGNMFLDLDMDGWYEQCLQCSHCRKLDVVDTGSKIRRIKTSRVTNLEGH